MGYYFHIDKKGKRPYIEPYLYTGDYKDGIAVVYCTDGGAKHIDMIGKEVHDRKFTELGVYHKGYSVARDEIGYFHIDKKGKPLYDERYRWCEPFYNDVAFSKDSSGRLGLLDIKRGFTPINNSGQLEMLKRNEIANVCHLIYQKGYNASIDGNISYRLSSKEILITPSGIHKGFIKPEDIIVIDYDGNVIRGKGKATSEFRLHIMILKKRPDINCVIHMHCPNCIAASLAGIEMNDIYITGAPVPITDFAMPSSAESPEKIEKFVMDYNWAILRRHGAVAFDKDLWSAFLRLEGMEHIAKILLLAHSCGNIIPLDDEKKKRLLRFFNMENQIPFVISGERKNK